MLRRVEQPALEVDDAVAQQQLRLGVVAGSRQFQTAGGRSVVGGTAAAQRR